MVVATCVIELDLPGIGSLKQKRSCLKSLVTRLHRTFNVSAAEVDLHDVWQSSSVGVSVVSNSAVRAERVLQNMIVWIEQNRPDVTVVDYHIEVIHF